jgi:hypothetical protein
MFSFLYVLVWSFLQDSFVRHHHSDGPGYHQMDGKALLSSLPAGVVEVHSC